MLWRLEFQCLHSLGKDLSSFSSSSFSFSSSVVCGGVFRYFGRRLHRWRVEGGRMCVLMYYTQLKIHIWLLSYCGNSAHRSVVEVMRDPWFDLKM